MLSISVNAINIQHQVKILEVISRSFLLQCMIAPFEFINTFSVCYVHNMYHKYIFVFISTFPIIIYLLASGLWQQPSSGSLCFHSCSTPNTLYFVAKSNLSIFLLNVTQVLILLYFNTFNSVQFSQTRLRDKTGTKVQTPQ